MSLFFRVLCLTVCVHVCVQLWYRARDVHMPEECPLGLRGECLLGIREE